MILIGYPKLIVPVLSIIAAVIIIFIKYNKKYKLPLEIYNGAYFRHPPIVLSFIYYFGCLLMFAGWMLAGFSALNPVRITPETKQIKNNCIVLYLIDVSPSMAASDILPTRLDRAVELIEASVKNIHAMHGLIAFGKEAVLVCPPTPQTDIFLERLYKLKPGHLGEGTNILAALKSSLLQLSNAKLNDSAIVLLSDGEDYESLNQLTMLFETMRIKTRIYFVALGDGGDVPVTYTDPYTQESITGMYRSQYNEEKLKTIMYSADITFYANPDTIDIAIENNSTKQSTFESGAQSELKLIGFALLFVFLGWLIVFGLFGGKA